jgi:hypothetical protein
MKPHILLMAFTFSFFLLLSSTSGADEPPTTSVHFINGASLELVSIKIDGKDSYPDLRQGNQISGGASVDLAMTIEAVSNTDGTTLKSFDPFSAGNSYVVTVIGDFLKVERTPENEDTLGFSPFDSKYITRAALIRSEVQPRGSGRYVTIINGIPAKPLTFSVGNETPESIPYGAISKTYAVSADAVDMNVAAADYSRKLKFNFLDHEDGILIVFFADATSNAIKYAVGRLRTLSMYQKFLQTTTETTP